MSDVDIAVENENVNLAVDCITLFFEKVGECMLSCFGMKGKKESKQSSL